MHYSFQCISFCLLNGSGIVMRMASILFIQLRLSMIMGLDWESVGHEFDPSYWHCILMEVSWQDLLRSHPRMTFVVYCMFVGRDLFPLSSLLCMICNFLCKVTSFACKTSSFVSKKTSFLYKLLLYKLCSFLHKQGSFVCKVGSFVCKISSLECKISSVLCKVRSFLCKMNIILCKICSKICMYSYIVLSKIRYDPEIHCNFFRVKIKW